MRDRRRRRSGVEAEKQQRYLQLIAQGVNNSEACRPVGINRKTGNRWRYGRKPLSPGNSRPSTEEHSCHLRLEDVEPVQGTSDDLKLMNIRFAASRSCPSVAIRLLLRRRLAVTATGAVSRPPRLPAGCLR
jgi:transposase-like protein